MMGTIVNRVNPGPLMGEHRQQPFVDGGEISFRKQPPGYAGLIRENEDLDSEFVRLSYGPGGIGDELKLFRTGEEIQLSVQSAIAVKEKSNLIDLHALIA